MDHCAFNVFNVKDICITEFDDTFEKYGSINTPLSRLPLFQVQGLLTQDFELYGRANSDYSVQEFYMPAEHWGLQLPFPLPASLNYYREHPEGHKHSLLSQPGGEVVRHVAAHTPILGFVTRKSALESLFTEGEFEQLQSSSGKVLRRKLCSTRLSQLAQQLHYQLVVAQKFQPTPSAELQVIDNLRDASIECFSLILDSLEGEPKLTNRERVLTSALDFIRQRYAYEIRLTDMVQHAHTTTRTLQLVFKSQFGLTPLQFLKHYRLARFHRGLRKYGTVTEAAIYSGLRHMGRLPDQYRSLFGENPGDYLSRHRDSKNKIQIQ